MGLRKLRADGSADTSFDVDGVVTLETGPSREIVEDSLVTPDGKIIVVGSSRHGFFIARYTSQGRLDNTFSGDGKQLVFFDNRYFDAVAKSVALAPDGKIVVGGYVKRMSLNVVDSDFAVVRLLANGALDLTFSYDGRQTTNLGGMDYGTWSLCCLTRKLFWLVKQPQSVPPLCVIARMDNSTETSLAMASPC